MSYGVIYTVPAPIELYDAVHAEAVKVPAAGLVMHLGRAVGSGFQIIEVWESKEQHDRYSAEVLGPIVGKIAGDAAAEPPVPEEFEVRDLLLPGRVGS